VDHIRSQVSQACLHYAAKPKGIYELTVPTGGGKTLASLRFALNHALHHKMERIFIIIPYTSIIDQNAREIRKILEDKNEKGEFLENVVLEHHSNLTPEKQTCRQTLLTQNWDAPIVLTTQVQFLETLFGSGTRSVRRMHQLVNSVIIFDEVQTIPIRCVHMFNIALRFLVNSCGATIVLSTATQPLLDKVVPSQRALNISREQHIIRSDDEVAELVRNQLQERGSVLVIVNTRKSARSLYTTLSQDQKGLVYHLSTNMCPAHRLEVLEMIKRKLLNNQPVICVSTQLIEAGVDIDFGAVIRYLAGLDSIAQAAGRCNRNGKQKDDKGNPTLGQVFIVNPANENITKLVDISVGAEIAQRILDDFNHNPALFSNDRIGLQAIKQYYQYYFHNRKSEMSYQVGPNTMVGRDDNLFNLLSTNVNSVAEYKRINGDQFNYHFAQSLKSAGKMFEVIDSHTQGVIVPYQEAGKDLVSALCEAKTLALLKKLVNKAQKYAVNLFPHELNQLVRSGAIQEVQKESGIYYLDARFYSDNLGWCETAVNKLDTLYYSEET
jgi:CRISPR-associated endonuclease/helicase Cas3